MHYEIFLMRKYRKDESIRVDNYRLSIRVNNQSLYQNILFSLGKDNNWRFIRSFSN